MGNFKRDGKKSSGGFSRGFGGGNSFGGGKRFDGRGDSRGGGRSGGDNPTRHKAICNECGVSCEVPFRPTGDRPVFCSDCFKNHGGDGGRPSNSSDKRYERPSFGDRPKFNVICAKCGKKCEVPFRPTPGKLVFCDDCFKQDGGGNRSDDGSKGLGEIIGQIKLLNSKMDRLMTILTPRIPAEMPKIIGVPKVIKEVATKKTVKEKKVKAKTKPTKKKVPAKKKK